MRIDNIRKHLDAVRAEKESLHKRETYLPLTYDSLRREEQDLMTAAQDHLIKSKLLYKFLPFDTYLVEKIMEDAGQPTQTELVMELLGLCMGDADMDVDE